jgi:hypothetical protein
MSRVDYFCQQIEADNQQLVENSALTERIHLRQHPFKTDEQDHRPLIFR